MGVKGANSAKGSPVKLDRFGDTSPSTCFQPMKCLVIALFVLNYANAIFMTCVASSDLRTSVDNQSKNMTSLEGRHHINFFAFGLLTSTCNTFLGLVAAAKASPGLAIGYVIATMASSAFNFIGALATDETRIVGYKVFIHIFEPIVLAPLLLFFSFYYKSPDEPSE